MSSCQDTRQRRKEQEPCFLCVCPLDLRAVVFTHCVSVGVVEPSQAAALINNYIIKLQVGGQQDKDLERRKYKTQTGDMTIKVNDGKREAKFTRTRQG